MMKLVYRILHTCVVVVVVALAVKILLPTASLSQNRFRNAFRVSRLNFSSPRPPPKSGNLDLIPSDFH